LIIASACSDPAGDNEPPKTTTPTTTTPAPDMREDMSDGVDEVPDMGADLGGDDQQDMPTTPDLGPPDTPDMGDDMGDGDMPGAPDMPTTPEDMGPDCSRDSDFDGLTDCDEAQLGTDPHDLDTDDDDLTDLEEITLSTDPLSADTDGDGLDDERENFFGFDPNSPSTLDDGILDGDRFIANACDIAESEPINYYKDSVGDWKIALSPGFTQVSTLTIPSASPPVAAAVYDDPTNEVAGFVFTSPKTGQDPVQTLVSYKNKIATVASITQDFTQGEFDTHDRFRAAPGEYRITAVGKSTKRLREELLVALAPFSRQDISQGLPVSSGNAHNRFIIKVSSIERDDRMVTLVALAPESLHETRDAVKFRLSDLTNTTSIAKANAGDRLKCYPFPIDTEAPTADFYWMLDQSGSMIDFNNTIRSFSGDFYNLVSNTGVDFRLGVANMDDGLAGRLRPTVGWHTDPVTFSNEIEYYVIDCTSNISSCSSFEEYGLYAAQEGIRYMKSAAASPAERIRANAALVNIIMTDERPESYEVGSKPNGPSQTAAQLFADYTAFFNANEVLTYAIVGGPNCGLEDGSEYGDVALATGGASALLCSADLTETITQIIDVTAGRTSGYRLNETPISSTLRVYHAGDDGKSALWVPRSRADGFDYFPQNNSLAFFGTYRPRVSSKT
ncbi:unnamed protein product, partial [Laminaria digitata]